MQFLIERVRRVSERSEDDGSVVCQPVFFVEIRIAIDLKVDDKVCLIVSISCAHGDFFCPA